MAKVDNLKNIHSYKSIDAFEITLINENGKTVYNISQNLNSVTLFLEAMFYPNAYTCLAIGAFNLFQNLKSKENAEDVLYFAYTQAFVAYYLKKLEKLGFIEIQSLEKEEKWDIYDYKKMIDPTWSNEEKKYVTRMYDIYFCKKRSFHSEDIEILLQLLKRMKIDTSMFQILNKNDIIFLKLKQSIKWKKIITGEFIKNIIAQRELILEHLKYTMEPVTNNQRKTKKRIK